MDTTKIELILCSIRHDLWHNEEIPLEEVKKIRKQLNEVLELVKKLTIPVVIGSETELNHDFKKGDDVWITSKKLVTIADFTECGKRVQVEDGCNYYLVDIDEITKVV